MDGGQTHLDDPADPKIPEELPETAPVVMYRLEWLDRSTSEGKQTFVSTIPFEPLVVHSNSEQSSRPEQADGPNQPAFEVITTVRGRVLTQDKDQNSFDGKSDENDNESGSQSSSNESDTEASTSRFRTKRGGLKSVVSFHDIRVTSVVGKKLVIYSQPLLELLRSCVTYYPGQMMTGHIAEVHEPFEVLCHHVNDFEDTISSTSESDVAHEHLAKLAEYLRTYMQKDIVPALARLAAPKPMVAFEDLWLLFKPGQDVYFMPKVKFFSHQYMVGVLMKTQRGQSILPSQQSIYAHAGPAWNRRIFQVAYWALTCDGTVVNRECMEETIEPYEGERLVTSLPVFPCKYLDNTDGGCTRRMLIKRGQRTYELSRLMPLHMFYDGREYFRSAISKTRTYCVLDVMSAPDLSQTGANLGHRPGPNVLDHQTAYGDMLDVPSSGFAFADFHKLPSADNPNLPSDRHCLLFIPHIVGFSLKSNHWSLFHVDFIRELPPSEGISNVFIDSVNHETIKAITYKTTPPFQLDEAEEKGEGQVVLLHGPPGVGKTYTVECIARSTGRPLIYLPTASVMSEDLNNSLGIFFRCAKTWSAIVLLDEADIFLERRATRDIERNKLVSAFLRWLEYFGGLLFLTSNRVGQIDDAVLSRVSIVLQYDHLTNDTRKKIWQAFFKKVQERSRSTEGETVEINKYARQYVLNDPEVKELAWNGREIRNAVQTAISLASYRSLEDQGASDKVVEVEEDHFKAVVAMSKKFKAYMRDISGKAEDERAQARLDRLAYRVGP